MKQKSTGIHKTTIVGSRYTGKYRKWETLCKTSHANRNQKSKQSAPKSKIANEGGPLQT